MSRRVRRAEAGARASRVMPWVVRAHRSLLAVRLIEAGLMGVAAGVAVQTAILGVGGELGGAQAWGLASLGGAVAAATWCAAHRASPADAARELDRSIGADGALITAYECECDPEGQGAGQVARKLSVSAASRASARVGRQGLRPSSLAAIAAPFAAVALLGWWIESRGPDRDVRSDLERLVSTLSGELGALRTEARSGGAELDPSGARKLAEVANGAARAADGLASGDSAPDALRELEEAFDELQRQAAEDDELARSLSRSRRWLDAARMQESDALGELAVARESDRVEADSRPELRGASGSASADTGGDAARTAPVGAGRPELGPEAPPGSGETGSSSTGSAKGQPGASTAGRSGRFWPAHLDAVVAGWIESVP